MAAAAPPRPAWRWMATGTTWQVHHSGGVGAEAARRVAECVEHDEARWSRFRPQSQVSQINRNAGVPVAVDPATLDLLAACTRWTHHTGGLFQPLVGAALAAWGYAESIHDRVPGVARSPQGAPVEGRIEINRERHTVRIPPGAVLDLGGIAKSWIARRAAALVCELSDDPSILVDAGGDLTAVRGSHRVGVEVAGAHAANLPEHDCAATWTSVEVGEGEGIATSGSGRRRWLNHDGVPAHHLIDPSCGRPGAEAQATVIAPDVVAADVAAKCLVLDPARLRTLDAAVLITGDERSATPGWDRRVAA